MCDGLIPATPSPRFTRFFAGYCRRMLARSFSNVRVTVGTPAVLRSLDGHDGPAIAAINHESWWDPLVGLVLADGYAPSRVLESPIEADQLRKFRFMRKIGLFGIDPADRGSYRVFVEHACSLFEREPRTLLGLTPQGAFTDVREPVRLRPGVAAVAARLSLAGRQVRVASIACEYVFWTDKKADLLIHASVVGEPHRPTTAGWTRAITEAMERDRLELAELSIARDSRSFEPLLGSGGANIHPVYDLWLRLRGQHARIRPEPGGGVPPGSPGDSGPRGRAGGTVA